MLKTIRWCFMGLCMAFANAQAVPTLLVVGGELIGADGVLVGATLYDVRFEDGTCIALFTGCDSDSDFTFKTLADAESASQALLDHVLLNGLSGPFDTSPALTAGCEDATCGILTPFRRFGTGVSVAVAVNVQGFDSVGSNLLPPGQDFSTAANAVWARWSPHVDGSVPEPGTIAILVAGLLALGIARRRHAMSRASHQ